MRNAIRWLSFPVGLLFLGLTAAAPAHANLMLDFNVSAHSPSVGSISYPVLGGPLIGVGIKPDNVVGLGTPLNDGVVATCLSCSLNFTTGNSTGSNATQWLFGPGGTVTLTGGVSATGLNIPTGTTLLTGTFVGAEVDKAGQTFKVTIAMFSDTKNPDLLAFFGLPNIPYEGNFNISFNAAGAPPGTFQSTNILSGDIVNTPTPEPGTMLLLGSGLFGFGYLARRRRSRG